MTETIEVEALPLNRKERAHLDVLQQRLGHLQVNAPERSGDPNYLPGEAAALAWVLSLITGLNDPTPLRLERLERAMRLVQTRLGRIEEELEDGE